MAPALPLVLLMLVLAVGGCAVYPHDTVVYHRPSVVYHHPPPAVVYVPPPPVVYAPPRFYAPRPYYHHYRRHWR